MVSAPPLDGVGYCEAPGRRVPSSLRDSVTRRYESPAPSGPPGQLPVARQDGGERQNDRHHRVKSRERFMNHLTPSIRNGASYTGVGEGQAGRLAG